MRRARIKVAPNLGSASRGPQKIENSVVKNNSDEPSPETELCLPKQLNSECVEENEKSCDRPSGTAKLLNETVEQTKVVVPDSTPLLVNVISSPPLIDSSLINCIHGLNKEPSTEAESLRDKPQIPASQPHVEEHNQSDDHSQATSVVHRFKPKPRVRPVLVDGPHRVRTFSSASESEDDAGRRNSQTPSSPVKKSATSQDLFENWQVNNAKKNGKGPAKRKREKSIIEMKKEAMKRKFAKGSVDRNQLTMFDLIYYNPVEPDKPARVQEKLQMRLKPYEVQALTKENPNKKRKDGDLLEEQLQEEEEMINLESGITDENTAKHTASLDTESPEREEESEEEAMPVPQVRLGPDGEIILDDQSLVIETTEAKRSKSHLSSAPVVVENSNTLVNYGSWFKRPRSARWSLRETARFYKALAMLGTNFSLMEKLFPNRPRIELKRKFKLEEKNNRQLVDKILIQTIPFDPSEFV